MSVCPWAVRSGVWRSSAIIWVVIFLKGLMKGFENRSLFTMNFLSSLRFATNLGYVRASCYCCPDASFSFVDFGGRLKDNEWLPLPPLLGLPWKLNLKLIGGFGPERLNAWVAFCNVIPLLNLKAPNFWITGSTASSFATAPASFSVVLTVLLALYNLIVFALKKILVTLSQRVHQVKP